MKEKLKTFFLNKATQYSLLAILCISLLGIVAMMISFKYLQHSHQQIVLIESSHNFPILTDVTDPYEGERLIKDKTFKENINLVIKKLLKSGDIAIDVGSGYGTQTILMSQLVGDKGEVYSFEPLPSSFKLLKYNTLMNQAHNVILADKLLYSSSIPVTLELLKDYPTHYFVHKNQKDLGDSTNKTINIQAYKADELIIGKHNIKVVNLGNHGNEFAVILGMQNIITYSPEISFIMHWNQKTFDIKAPYYKEIIANFYQADFDFFIINADGTLSLIRQDQLYSYNEVDLLITKAEIH